MKKRIFIMVLFVLFSPFHFLFGDDLSKSYSENLEKIDTLFNEALIKRLQQYKILLVPGFLSNLVIDLGKMGPYFDEQMNLFSKMKIDYQKVGIESEGSPAWNAKIISKAIQESRKPVIILAHSKGGIDTLEMLITEKDKNLLNKIKGFIPVQTPFWGSPIADWVSGNMVLSKIACKLLRELGGSKESLLSLTTKVRKDYFEKNKKEILSALHAISTIAFASWKKNEPWKWDTILEWFRNAMEENKILNDGLVPVESAVFPETDVIKISEIDHVITFMDCDFVLRYNRVHFTKVLLLMILKKIEPIEFK